MIEREVIQSVGFRNVKEDGKITGFQFRVRIPYYRGIYLWKICKRRDHLECGRKGFYRRRDGK